jgi:ubiquinone/menaquinone biosynthesis C-methylase UbiE
MYFTLINNILRSEVDPAYAKRARFILENVVKAKPKKILEIGCGRGFYIRSVSMFDFPKEIVGVDVNKEYLNATRSINKNDARVTIKKGSIYGLPFADNYFDCIICSEVLEHLDDDLAGAKELHRILKPSGIAIFSVPNNKFPFLWDPLNWLLMIIGLHIPKHIWWLAGIWADHERLYTVATFQSVLKKSGFMPARVKKIVHWCWPFSHFVLYGIGKNLVERAGTKSFDRFNFNSPKPVSSVIAFLFALPSKLLDKRLPLQASVNLAVVAKKK